MEKKSNNLEIKSMTVIAEQARQYIEDRKEGREKSLRVRSEKINRHIMNGFDWNRIITIAGLSGSGKSTLCRQLIKDMIELNKDQEFDVLSFQFEMLGIDEVARDLSAKTDLSVKNIYSAETPLSDKNKAIIDSILESLKSYPIYVVDNIGTVKNIIDTIFFFVTSRKLVQNKKGLVITIDHTLLVKPEDGADEKITIDLLMHSLVALKKYLVSIGLKVIFFVLSQLNRNIETNERIINPRLHYPNKNDLFGASSIYYSSDYVMILHKPSIIEGLGKWYGPERTNFPYGLPVFNPEKPSQPLMYLHIIKERFGSNGILTMVDELDKGKISDYVHQTKK